MAIGTAPKPRQGPNDARNEHLRARLQCQHLVATVTIFATPSLAARAIVGFMFSRRTAWDVSPNRLSRARDHHHDCGRTELDLTCSNPTSVGLVYSEDFYADLFDPRSLAYEPEPFGLQCAREAVARDYYRPRRIDVRANRVCLTASTSEAYHHLLSLLCDPGDAILVPTPSYPLLDYLAGVARVDLVRYPLHYDGHWWTDTAALAELIRRHAGRLKALVCIAPNNPTGSYLTHTELAAIEALCVEHELTLIVDEVFSDYPLHSGPSRVASVIGERECLTFALSGLSKVAALPQLKLAWTVACGPEELVAPALARLSVISDTFLNLATPIQHSLGPILQASVDMQAQIRGRLVNNLELIDLAIADSPITRLSVEAGWTAILRLPKIGDLDDEGWALRMLERLDVWVQPGSLFDMAGCHVVVSLLTPTNEFAEGMARLVACVEQMCARNH
jgi:alanine-synthesizing transaminase